MMLRLIGISAGADLPGTAEFDAALAAAASHLPPPADPAAGFLIVHRGTQALWAIIGRWQLDILYLATFRAELGTVAFAPVQHGGPPACVWELQAIDAERRFWVRHVLARSETPDIAGYLDATSTVEQ
jgi:hypothetical protein